MNTLHTIALCVILTSLTSNATEDPVAHSSPDGSVSIRNVGDTSRDHWFQIVKRNGDVLLDSSKHTKLESGSFAEAIIWSPDNRYVAFSVRTSGPYIHDTFVYSLRSNLLLAIPTDDNDYQTTPVRWLNARTLIVETAAPFGGKATEERADAQYRYRRTIRISEKPLRTETLYTAPRSRPRQRD